MCEEETDLNAFCLDGFLEVTGAARLILVVEAWRSTMLRTNDLDRV